MSGKTGNGPRVVAVGGGHGASQSLRAAALYAGQVTGIISVADDGGSSGRLRAELGIPAPGDIRRCIAALLPDGSPLAAALEHRFENGEKAGHAFGNLLIATLTEMTGDFSSGTALAARLVGASGRVLPATAGPVVLKGSGKSGEVEGQVRIMDSGGVSRVELAGDVRPASGVVEAIASADQVVIGPGSLYTSLLAATVVPAIRQAIAEASGQVVYVANLREQRPETTGYSVADHVAALLQHGVEPQVVLADPRALPLGELPGDLRLLTAPLAGEGLRAHEPQLLAEALSGLLVANQATASRK